VGGYWYFRDESAQHPAITEAELAVLPKRRDKARRRGSVGRSSRHCAGDAEYFCYGWCLWLLPELLLIFFKDKSRWHERDGAVPGRSSTRLARWKPIGACFWTHPSQDEQRRKGGVGAACSASWARFISLMPDPAADDKVMVAVCLSGRLLLRGR